MPGKPLPKRKAKGAGGDSPRSSPSTPKGFITKLVDELVEKAGEGTAQILGSEGLAIKIRGVLSTQCATLDAAIGRGGVPFGRLTIIHGPEGSGKTTLALHLVAECQAQGGIVLYMDKEYKLDPDYAKNIGVDTDNLIISQPPYLEKCFEIFEATVNRARKYREDTGRRVPIMIVLDSMNAAISKAEFEGDYEDQHMAAIARVYSKSLPKLMPLVNAEDVALVFVSQVREKVGVMFGRKDDIAGGRGPKFYASLIMEVKRTGSISKTGKKKERGEKRESGDTIGNRTEVYVRKNQIAPPFRTAGFDIMYGTGINRIGATLELGITKGVVEQSGAWLSFKGKKIGQGMRQACEKLEKDPERLARIVEAIKEG